MNFQPLIDNLPFILVALGFALWAAAQLVNRRAKNDPAETWEDGWAETLMTLSELGAKGIDLLAQVLKARGDNRLATGQQKAQELQVKVAKWEALWKAGKRREAVVDAFGWYVDLQGKVERLPAPFASGAVRIPAPTTPSNPEVSADDPDPDKTTDLDNTPAS